MAYDSRRLNDLMRAYYLEMLEMLEDGGMDVTIVGDTVGLAREVTLGALAVSAASLDTKEGITGAAADVDGVRSAQLRYMGEALDTALEYYEEWDEGGRLKVNPIVGETGVASGFGATDDLTQRVVMAEDSPDVEALEIMAAWDDGSERADVNLIGDIADLDTGVGEDFHEVVAIGLPSDGGFVVGGTSTDPFFVNANLQIGDLDISEDNALPVMGTAADGATVSGNPVRIAGKDGDGVTQDILTDGDGHLQVGIDQTTPGTTNAVASIAGQAGVAGGAGATDALTQRVVAASDSPDVTALEIIDDWDATHDGAGTLSADGPQIMLEAVEFDGVAFPNAATEGRPVRMKGLLSGVVPVKRVSEDGSHSIEDEVNNADRVIEIADARQSSVTVEIQAATVITAAEVVIGGEINVLPFNTMTIWIDYTIGDETSYDIIPKFLRVTGGDEHAYGVWSAGAVKAFTAEVFRFTASGKHAIVLDVTGINIVKIYGDATAGTPTGVSDVSYSLTNN